MKIILTQLNLSRSRQSGSIDILLAALVVFVIVAWLVSGVGEQEQLRLLRTVAQQPIVDITHSAGQYTIHFAACTNREEHFGKSILVTYPEKQFCMSQETLEACEKEWAASHTNELRKLETVLATSR